eukprot:6285175-Amphidinium_carterae.3
MPLRAATEVMYAVDHRLATVDPAQVVHGTQCRLWANALQHSAVDDLDLWAALAYSANRLHTAKSPWAVTHGPSGAWLLTCIRLGLTMRSQHVIESF